MKIKSRGLTLFWVSLLFLAGCEGGAPNPASGNGTGTPAGGPGGGVGSPVLFPPVTTNQFMASGTSGGFSQSSRFRAYEDTVFLNGTRSQGNNFRMVSPQMSLGEKGLR